MPPSPPYQRIDELDPLPYAEEWPSLRSAWGRIDIHSLAAFWVHESNLEGNYLEFGVGSGRSAVAAIRANQRINKGRIHHFFLFDSFAGLPELAGPDEGAAQFHTGDFAFGVDEVIAKLDQHGISRDLDITLVPGFFEESLPTITAEQLGHRRAAIVHIDVDLHSSCAEVLSFVAPHLQPGAILLFDDWNCFAGSSARGERLATRQWLERNPQFRIESYAKYGWHGEAFLVDF